MISREFYKELGKLVYALAKADGEIQVKESQRIDLEKQIRDKKIEIQEVTVTKYLRPKINSPDSSFIFLKEFIK